MTSLIKKQKTKQKKKKQQANRMDEWKRDFDQWLWDSYVNVDKTTSQTVTKDYVKKVLDYLQNDRYPDEMDRQQRHNFKHKVFIYLLCIFFMFDYC